MILLNYESSYQVQFGKNNWTALIISQVLERVVVDFSYAVLHWDAKKSFFSILFSLYMSENFELSIFNFLT